jgi:hypothetical protein
MRKAVAKGGQRKQYSDGPSRRTSQALGEFLQSRPVDSAKAALPLGDDPRSLRQLCQKRPKTERALAHLEAKVPVRSAHLSVAPMVRRC